MLRKHRSTNEGPNPNPNPNPKGVGRNTMSIGYASKAVRNGGSEAEKNVFKSWNTSDRWWSK